MGSKIQKHLLSIILILTLVIGILPITGGAQESTVTEQIEHGFIPIANKTELRQIENMQSNTFGAGTAYEKTYTGGLDKKYILVSNIDLSGENFVPIGYNDVDDTVEDFVGTFDGNGYTVSNLTIDREKELQGLFSKLGNGAVVENININGATLKTDSRTGVIAGQAEGSVIRDSSITNVNFDFNDSDKIRNCIGGFVGKSYNAEYKNLKLNEFYMINDNGKGPWNMRMNIGGITGFLDSGSIVDVNVDNIKIHAAADNVLETGAYYIVMRVGGVAGEIQNSSTKEMTVDNCTVTDLDFKFGMDGGTSPSGGLIGMVGGPVDYEIKSDIFIKNSSVAGNVLGTPGGLGITYFGGFIGYAGSVVSTKINVFLENCNSSVMVKDILTDFSYSDTATSHGTGGFASNLNYVKAVNCSAAGSLDSGALVGTGGFAGHISNSSIEGCSASGDVLGYFNLSGFAMFVNNSNIKQCYATGDIKKATDGISTLNLSGGFVCWINGNSTITDCYYTGDIGDEDSYMIGGFAYRLGGTVTNTYTSGVVKGNSRYAFACTDTDAVTSSYWNTTANPDISATPEGKGDIHGVSYDNMKKKETFVNWNISDKNERAATIWKIEEGVKTPYFTPKQSSDAMLINLTISSGTLSPVFTKEVCEYNTSVVNNVQFVTLTPTVSNENAIVFVDGKEVISNSASDEIALVIGSNCITVEVIAQDGTKKQYFVTVVREAPEEGKGNINGVLTNDVKPDPEKLKDVTVTVKHGEEVLDQTVTNSLGEYSFTDIEYGIYSLVATKGGQTVTKIIKVSNATENGDMVLPMGQKNTVVETKPNTPPIAVEGLNHLFSAPAVSDPVKGVTQADLDAVTSGGKVEIKLTAEKKKESDVAEDAAKLKILTGTGKEFILIDLTVTKKINDNDPVRLTELSDVVEIVLEIPNDLKDKTALSVLRVHDKNAEVLSSSETDDEYFRVEGNYIHIFVKKFSTYAIAFDKVGGEIVPGTGDIINTDLPEKNNDEINHEINNEMNENPNTEDTNGYLLLVSGLALLSLMGVILIGCKKSKHERLKNKFLNNIVE
ncbi:MAG: hypothetical protein DBX47_04565 [Clostridiales bacterium]|nr:MAG: hypothetical protein DBX47_04565 [Clostridiales bacterium]